MINNKNDSLDDNGFFDYIAEIEDNSTKITEEISSMCDELNDMNIWDVYLEKEHNNERHIKNLRI